MLKIPREFYETMLAHLKEGYPNEACGLIAGQDGRAVQVYKMANIDPNPRVRYQIDPKDLLEAFREFDRNDWDLLAIFHSHPHTKAYPSPTDVKLAAYPEAYYIIFSLQDLENPVARVFRILSGEIHEEDLMVVDPSD